MPSQLELFKQMSFVLDQLVDTANTLNESVTLNVGRKDLEAAQERQQEILRELATLDELILKSPPGAAKEELDVWRLRIREKLSSFQSINQEFFNRLDSHMRIIEQSKTTEETPEFD